jgi:glycosyltransferase involved in cell wall biosynthesis
MRILFITQGFPADGVVGGQIGNYYHVLELSRAGHDVTLLCLVPRGCGTAEGRLGDIARVVPVEGVPPNSLSRYALNLLDPLPWPVRRYALRAAARKLAGLLRAEVFDLVFFNSLHSATLLPTVRRRSDAPCLLFEHNVQSVIMELYASVQRSAPARMYGRAQWRKTLSFERRALRSFDLVLTFSEVDRDRLALLSPGARLDSVPLSLDVRSLAARTAAEQIDVLFVGYLGWEPNADSLAWFLTEVHPELLRRRPGTRVDIVGAGAPRELADRALAHELVRFHGRVEDVFDFYAKARVVVVPLRIGSGVRVKIVQAMAMGRAVVSTSKGCEGLDLTDGVHLLLADRPEDFAAAVVHLLNDPAARGALGARARERALERHDALAPRPPLVAACESLVARSKEARR